jgi:glycosyltransferase involved in cell wall biosynthesis
MPLLTVGIPVFNAMPYLKESVQSILTQSYSNFELLIVNDGSTDGSLEYLQSLRDPRVRIIHQANRGLTATLNRMLAEANSPWLVRQDADDFSLPHRLSRVVDSIYEHPRSGMFCSLAEYYPEGCCGRFRSTIGEPQVFRKLVLSGYLPTICHPTVTLNVNKAIAVGGYRFNHYVEDIDLWWRMALACDIRLIPEVTLGFRQNLESVSSANLARQVLNTRYIQYLLLSHLWNLDPLPYEQACVPLKRLVNPRSLRFKSHLRQFNIEMGQGHRLKALGELGAAFLSSPQSFVRRVLDEVDSGRIASLGENPEVFAQNRKTLWPHSGQDLRPMQIEQQRQMILGGTEV